MKPMTFTFFLSVTMILAAFSDAQIRRNVPPHPESTRLNDRVNALFGRGQTLLDQKRFEEAVKVFEEAAKVEDVKDLRFGRSSGADYRLAKALTLANRPDKALKAYRKAFWWDDRLEDIVCNGPPMHDVGVDYALLLAKRGMLPEAKAMYYRILRAMSWSGEYFPFLVVFDQDPSMVAWEMGANRIISVLTMVKAQVGGQDEFERLEWIREQQPAWLLPVAHTIVRRSSFKLIDLASALARTPDEKQWITDLAEIGLLKEETLRITGLDAYRRRMSAIGVERRKNSAVLKQAKLDMEKFWPRLCEALPKKQGSTN